MTSANSDSDPRMTPASVTIVILNWNGKALLEQFLPSVMATDYEAFTVLVVDNASTDDSISWLETNYPEVELLVHDQNYGFTTGNNMALPHVKTPYFVLLNNDVEVHPGWLRPLVELMESDENIASIQPKLLAYQDRTQFEYAGAAGGFIDWLGYPFSRGRLFDLTEPDEGQYEEPAEILWSTGACMLVRKAVTDRIGLFEDRYFAHMEEIDFCWRARNFGYRVMYHPGGVVWHLGGGTLPKTNPRKTFLNVRNSLATLLKNFPASQVPYKFFFRLVLDGVWGMRAVAKGDFATVLAIFKGHMAIYGSFGFWLKRRKEIYADLDRVDLPPKGYYPKSVVWQHFGKGVKRFWDLKGMPKKSGNG